jgi:hypothetical protein
MTRATPGWVMVAIPILALGIPRSLSPRQGAPDRWRWELARGIDQVRRGEPELAIDTLNAVAQGLAELGNRGDELAKARLHLSIAYFELGQESRAEELFIGALAADPTMELRDGEFEPRHLAFVFGLHERLARCPDAGGAVAAPVEPRPGGAAAEGQVPPEPEVPPEPLVPTEAQATGEVSPNRGGSRTWLLVGLGATAAAVGGVLAAGGGSDGGSASTSSSATTTSPPPTTAPAIDNDGDGYTAEQDCNDSDRSIHPYGEVSASFSSSIAFQTVRCGDSEATSIFLTNRSCSPISVVRITRQVEIIGGGCVFSGNDSTLLTGYFPPTDSRVSAGVGETVWSHSRNIGGCCDGRCTGVRCTLLATLSVDTSVGNLGAGSYQYNLVFTGCPPCSAAAASCPDGSAPLQ